MSVVAVVLAALAAGATGMLAFQARAMRISRVKRKAKVLEAHIPKKDRERRSWSVVGYMEDLTRRLYVGSTRRLIPVLSRGREHATRSHTYFETHAKKAGCSGSISAEAFCEARNRFTFVGVVVGALIGCFFSNEMTVLLAGGCGFAARTAPDRALRDMQSNRAHEAERCLSEMLEVVSLGLRSGLTFDRSFALYGQHFTSGFARSCALAHRRWALGLSTREEALRSLAQSYDCEQLERTVESIIRGLRLGTSLTGSLEEAASQSRAAHKAAVEERVAKAPVKMMVPTGTLILPAMLLLVLGPIVLELINGF